MGTTPTAATFLLAALFASLACGGAPETPAAAVGGVSGSGMRVPVSAAVDPAASDAPQLLRVGPGRGLTTVAAAARQARNGDTVEIDAGEYLADVATWPQNDLTIRAIGGKARMVANGASAEGKAIWVIRGHNVRVENVEFSGARVPNRNGAGIRHEGGKLIVRGCLFERNEMGLMTWNDASAELEVESSEFRDNALAGPSQPGDPVGHQIYVGRIGRFTLRASYLRRGAFGHLVKSRARESDIRYNRITDEAAGRASYELDFPDGGIAYVVGNIVQQSAATENEALIAFGAEGYHWPRNELYLVNNTLVDGLPHGGVFLRVAPGAAAVNVTNNLLLGRGRLPIADRTPQRGNFAIRPADVAAADAFDFRLTSRAPPLGRAIEPGMANGVNLRPEREYRHPLGTQPVAAGLYSPGALQSMAP